MVLKNIFFTILIMFCLNQNVTYSQVIIKRIDNYVLIDKPIEMKNNQLSVIRLQNNNIIEIGTVQIILIHQDTTAAKIIEELPGYTISINDKVLLKEKLNIAINDNTLYQNIGRYFNIGSSGLIALGNITYNNHERNSWEYYFLGLGGAISFKGSIYIGFQQSKTKYYDNYKNVYAGFISTIIKPYRQNSPIGVIFNFNYAQVDASEMVASIGTGLSFYGNYTPAPFLQIVPEIGVSAIHATQGSFKAKFIPFKSVAPYLGFTFLFKNLNPYIFFFEYSIGYSDPFLSSTLNAGLGIPF